MMMDRRLEPVIYVNARGTARVGRWPGFELEEEARRMEAIRARSAPPDRVSPHIVAAPARLNSIAETPRETAMTDNGPRTHRAAPVGFDRVRVGDAFDVMEEQARKAHAGKVAKARKAGKEAPAFVPPFSTGQVEVGREYAALVERCSASGVKCSSLEALRVSASNGGDREAAMLQDLQRLRVLQRRIGDGLAKEVRRIRPGGEKRRAIRVRALVDQVCLSGKELSAVLRAHGWGKDQKAIGALAISLRDALDRMQGFSLERDARSFHSGRPSSMKTS